MRRFSSVVLLETLFEISGCSHIAFTSRGATFNKIDVMHWPFFAETSEGVLLRASEHLSPAKRQARSRTEGVRFELTRPFGLPVFKTGAINRSATPPEKLSLDFAIVSAIGNQLQIVGQALRLPFFWIGRRSACPTRELLLDMWICSCELSACGRARNSDLSLR